MEIEKRAHPLKKQYTEDQVTKDNQKYIQYTLDALVRQYINHVRIKAVSINLVEFTKPVNDCSIALIARLITPQILDIPKITSIIDWWITTCKLVSDYVSLHPNEETAVEFINSLPEFL